LSRDRSRKKRPVKGVRKGRGFQRRGNGKEKKEGVLKEDLLGDLENERF